jgi:putative ABC transport system permease protein
MIRALKGAVRSPLRTGLVVLLLAVGLSFALTAVALAYAAEDELDKVKATTGVEASISINPEQFRAAIQEQIDSAGEGDEGGFSVDIGSVQDSIEPLTTEDVAAIEKLPYVRDVEGFAVAPVEYEVPGQEETEEAEQPETPQPGPNGGLIRNISPPDATLTGIGDPAFVSDFREGTKSLVDGKLFGQEDAGKSVVVIDQNTATADGLKVGDTITLKSPIFGPIDETQEGTETQYTETTAEIIGIYEDTETASGGGLRFDIAEWYAPLDVVAALQDESQAGELSSISLIVDSVDDFDTLRSDLAGIIDPELYSLNTSEDSFSEISDPIETMRNTSLVVMVVGLAVVGAIMVMLMVLVMRSRLREIGILRAIGARSRDVVAQFSLETVGIALLAVVIAVPSVFAINTFLPDLIRPSAEAAEEEGDAALRPGPGGGPPGAVFIGPGAQVEDPVRTEEVEAALGRIDASVSGRVVGIGAAVAVLLGLVGSLVTVVTVLRLRPADVLRMEG